MPSSFAQRSFKNQTTSSRGIGGGGSSIGDTAIVRVIAVRPSVGGGLHSARSGLGLDELRKQQSGSPSISVPAVPNGCRTPQPHPPPSRSPFLRQPSSGVVAGAESSVVGVAPSTRTNGAGEDDCASSLALAIGSASTNHPHHHSGAHHQHSVSFAPISPTHHRMSGGASSHQHTTAGDRDEFGCACGGLNSQYGGGGAFGSSAKSCSIEDDLRRSSTFGREIASWPTHLQAEMCSRLAAAFTPRSCCVGELLFAEGQPVDAAYFVRVGFVELRADKEAFHAPATVVKEACNPSSPPPMPGTGGANTGNGSSLSPLRGGQPRAPSFNSSPRFAAHRPAASIGLFSDFAGRDPGVSSYKGSSGSAGGGLQAVDESVAPLVAAAVATAAGEKDDDGGGGCGLHSFSVSRGQTQSIKVQPSRRRSTGGTTVGASSVIVRRSGEGGGVGSLALALQSQSQFSPAEEATPSAEEQMLSPGAAIAAALAHDTITLATKVAGECFGGEAIFHCTEPALSAVASASASAQQESPQQQQPQKLRSHYAVVAQQHTELLVLSPESFQAFLQSWEERVFALRLAAAVQLQQQQHLQQPTTNGAALSPTPPASGSAVRRWFRSALSSPPSATPSADSPTAAAAGAPVSAGGKNKKKLVVKSAQGDMVPNTNSNSASNSHNNSPATAARSAADGVATGDEDGGPPRNASLSAAAVTLTPAKTSAASAAAAASALLPQPPSAALLRSTLLQCFGFGFAAALSAHLPGVLTPRTMELVSLLFERVRLEPGHVLMREGETGQFLPPAAPASTISPSMLGATASLSAATVRPITPRLGSITREHSPTMTRASSPTAFVPPAATPMGATTGSAPGAAFFPPVSPLANASTIPSPSGRSASMLVAGGGHLLSSGGSPVASKTPPQPSVHVREPRLYFLLEGNLSCSIRGNPSARRSKVHRILDSTVPPHPISPNASAAPSTQRYERAHSASRSSITGAARSPSLASPVPRAMSIHVGSAPGSNLLPHVAALQSPSQGGTPVASPMPSPARSASFATPSAAALLSPPNQSSAQQQPQQPISPRSPPPFNPKLVSSGSAEKAAAAAGAGSLPVSVSTVAPKSASPPTFLGEMGVLLGVPRTATLRCGPPSIPTAAGHCCVLLEVRTLDRFRALLLLVPAVLAGFLGRIQLSLHLHLCHFLSSSLLAKGFVTWISKREMSGENFAFWKATKAFRAAYSKNLLSGQRNRQSAKDILERYVGLDGNEADTPVNLCGATVANILARWNRANAIHAASPPPLESSKSSLNVHASTTGSASNTAGSNAGSNAGLGLDADLFLEAEEEILGLMNSDSFPRFRSSDVLAKSICESVGCNILGMACPGELSINTSNHATQPSSSIPPSPSGASMPLHRGATMRAPGASLMTSQAHHQHSGSTSDARSSSSTAVMRRSQTKMSYMAGGAATTLVGGLSFGTASPGSVDGLGTPGGTGGFDPPMPILQPRPSPSLSSASAAHHRHSKSVGISPLIRPRIGVAQSSNVSGAGAGVTVTAKASAAGAGPNNSAGVASVAELGFLEDGICAPPRVPPVQLLSSTPSPKILVRRGSSLRLGSSLATTASTTVTSVATPTELEENHSLHSSPHLQRMGVRPSPLPSPGAEGVEERDGWLDAGGPQSECMAPSLISAARRLPWLWLVVTWLCPPL